VEAGSLAENVKTVQVFDNLSLLFPKKGSFLSFLRLIIEFLSFSLSYRSYEKVGILPANFYPTTKA